MRLYGLRKIYCGKDLGEKMGCQCVDLDKYIEDTAGMSIPEIFDKYGEEHFRKLETEALAAFADIGGVVATGGGALLSEENGKVAKRSGMVVFIDTYFNTCYGRIKTTLTDLSLTTPPKNSFQSGLTIEGLYILPTHTMS